MPFPQHCFFQEIENVSGGGLQGWGVLSGVESSRHVVPYFLKQLHVSLRAVQRNAFAFVRDLRNLILASFIPTHNLHHSTVTVVIRDTNDHAHLLQHVEMKLEFDFCFVQEVL